jgi:RTX calcium-binding nonapeptide repeat (4 copies)
MRVALVAVVATLACAPRASAATVELIDRGPNEHSTVSVFSLSFRAAPGEANDVTFDASPAGVMVRDAGAPVAAGSGCQPVPGGAQCSQPIAGAAVDLGDGDDRIVTALLQVDVLGGPGDDTIEVGSGTLDGGHGADVMRVRGPQAASTVSYATRTAGVSVTEDGVANDGEPGEGDDVGPGIVAVTGGSGDDVLFAGDEPHHLDGRAGNDRLVGGPRDDDLTGGLGDDVLLGAGGDDQLLAGPGADVIRGGPGRDATNWAHAIAGVRVTLDDRRGDGVPGEGDDVGSDVEVLSGTRYDDVLVGSAGRQVLLGAEGDDRLDGAGGDDQLAGGAGDRNVLIGGAGSDRIGTTGVHDTIRTRDGEHDAIGCGPPASSRQRFEVDRRDAVRGCATDLHVRDGQRLRADRRRRVAIAGHCPARRGTCVGSIRLTRCRRTGATIGHASFRVAEGRVGRVPVQLTPRARDDVAQHHAVCAWAMVRSRRAAPPPSRVDVTVALRLLA